MRVLVSAFACDPYLGSEAGVGWRALQSIASRHEVCALVGSPNKRGWQKAQAAGIVPVTVRVRFVEGSTACSRSRFIARFQSWLNYASFHRRVLAAAMEWHAEEHFDLCHQVTIAGWRMPSPLWRMPIPFLWGPIGGAGHIPRGFRPMLSLSARLFEKARDLNTWWAMRQQEFLECMKHTAVIFAANQETLEFLRPFRGEGEMVRLPIASFPEEVVERFRRPADMVREPGPLRLFAGGNIEGRKGVALALEALALVKQAGVDFRYTIAGGGPDIPHLKNLTEKLRLGDQVEFNLGYQGDDYVSALWRSDIYLLPSFRESTPVTLLEAMLAGCHPVVADTSAQGEIVALCGGDALPVDDVPSLIRGLAEVIVGHGRNLERLADPGIAERVAEHFSSERYDQITERAYTRAIGKVG